MRAWNVPKNKRWIWQLSCRLNVPSFATRCFRRFRQYSFNKFHRILTTYLRADKFDSEATVRNSSSPSIERETLTPLDFLLAQLAFWGQWSPPESTSDDVDDEGIFSDSIEYDNDSPCLWRLCQSSSRGLTSFMIASVANLRSFNFTDDYGTEKRLLEKMASTLDPFPYCHLNELSSLPCHKAF